MSIVGVKKLKTLITIQDPDLIKNIFLPEALEKLDQIADVDWLLPELPSEEENLIHIIQPYDVLIASWGSFPITENILKKATNLKFIGYAAGSVTNFIPISFFETNITLVNANHILAKATAEGTLALMHYGAWQFNRIEKNLSSGKWSQNNKESVQGISGQTIGLIGYGAISKEVIRLLAPYECTILLCSSHCSDIEAESLGIRLCGLNELLRESTIISLHNTLTQARRNMLGFEELSLIQEGALLINTARAALIDENSLLKVLRKEKFNAVLDVFHEEPLPQDSILLQLPNVICTPHIAAFPYHWKSQLGLAVVNDLISWHKNQPLIGKVTKSKYRFMTRQ